MITVTCPNKSCGAIYRAYRQLDPITHTIKYCMFCAQPDPSITQNPDQDLIDTLAQAYDKPHEVIKLLLKVYNAQSKMSFRKLVTGSDD